MATETKFVPITFTPGLMRDTTEYGAEGSWYSADKVRFKAGNPETMGGYQRYNESTFEGIARAQHQWALLDGRIAVGIGTHNHLYIWNGGAFNDITPVDTSKTFPNIINTVTGQTSIIASINNHGRTAGDYVYFVSATPVGNVDVMGREFLITSVIDIHTVVLENTTVATLTSSGGGNVAFQLPIISGYQSNNIAFGYGRSTYSSGPYSTPVSTSGVIQSLRLWNLNNWGEDLLANYKGGPLYYWDATNGFNTRATIVTSTPSIIDYSYISQPTRHFVMVGTTEVATSVYDPLLIRWSSDGDFTDVVPSGINTAGDFRMDAGSRVYGVESVKNETLIWTDAAVFVQRYVGAPFYFSHERLGDNTGLMGPNAKVDQSGVIFWMGTNNFFKYDGAISQLNCTLRKDIFDVGGDNRIDYNQREKTYAAVNTAFNEIMWLYQSENSTTGEVDRYVIFNYVENAWYDGSWNRTTWQDSGLFDSVLATGDDGYLYSHELGIFESNEDMNSFLESAAFDIEDGDEELIIRTIIPDLNVNTAITMTLYTKQYPNSASWTVSEAFTVTSSTTKIDVVGARGRQAKLRIEADGLNAAWRLGKVRFGLKKHGKRG